MTEHVIELPWSKPPLSMNDRDHWAKKAKKVRNVRQTTAWLAKAANLGRHELVRVQLHYRPATRRNRDSDNIAATYKPCVDGVCLDAGLVADDTDEHVVRGWPTIHAPIKGEPGRMWLVVEVLDTPDLRAAIPASGLPAQQAPEKRSVVAPCTRTPHPDLSPTTQSDTEAPR